MSTSANNLYSEPVGLPDPFSENDRFRDIIARSRQICGLPEIELPASLDSQSMGVNDDLMGACHSHQAIQAVLGADVQFNALRDAQEQGMEQR